jgi:phage gp29-like protein
MEDNLLENKNTKQGLADEIATRKRSLNFYSLGYMLPDPDPILRKQGKDMKIYRELLCDAHVFACVQSRKSGVLSLEWEINRGLNKDSNSKRIEDLLKSLDIYQLIKDILDCAFFGFQPIEVLWEKIDNLILPVDVKAKPPEWFCFDEENNLKFRTKENYWGEELPDKKFLCPQSNASYDNPYGERVLSRVFWPVTFKKGGMKFWVIFTEKYGMPHLVGKHPRGASKEETDTLADLLENMLQDAIAVIPDDSSVEIQEAEKSSSADIFEKLIDKMNAEVSKAILGQTLTTEIGSTGSYAASQTHMGVRADIVDADKKLVEKTINQLIKWIYELNFADCRQSAQRSGDTFNAGNQVANQDIPQFEMYEIEDVDLNLAQRDKVLTESGVKFSKEYFIKNYGFDEQDLEIAEVKKPTEFKQFKEENDNQGQDEVDRLFDLISEDELQSISNDILKPLLKQLAKCKTEDDFKKILDDKNLKTEMFEDVLSKALFLCEAQGRYDGLE